MSRDDIVMRGRCGFTGPEDVAITLNRGEVMDLLMSLEYFDRAMTLSRVTPDTADLVDKLRALLGSAGS